MATVKRERISGRGNKGYYKIHNKGHITYQFIKRVKGIEVCGTYESLPLAKEQFEAKKAEILAGTYSNKKGTLQQVYDHFCELKGQSIGTGRKITLDWAFEKYIKPSLNGNKQIKNITKEDIDSFLVRLHNSGKAESTMSLAWAVCRMIFRYALTNDFVSRDVTAGKHYVPSKEKMSGEETPYSTDEQKRLLNYTYQSRRKKPAKYLTLLFSIKAGLRLGEMLGLRWSDINLEKGIITVASQFNQHEKKLTVTKTGNIRDVLINKDLLAFLTELKETRSPEPSDFLFPAPDSKRREQDLPMSHTAVGIMLSNLGKKLGIANVHHHRGRHTFATELRLHGADKTDISRLLGHALPGMTDHYIYSQIGYQPCTVKAIDLIGEPYATNVIPFPDRPAEKNDIAVVNEVKT